MITVDVSKMHEYQKKALEFSINNPCSYQALDMGLGKTFIALKWAEQLLRDPTVKGVLVVSPLRPVYTTWPEECKKWTPNLTYTILHGPDKLNNLHANTNLYFINWDGIPWLYESLKTYWRLTKKMPFRAVVLDEGSMLKSTGTKRFKIMKKLKDIFPKWRLILSATPAPKSLLDIWSQYFFLDNGKRLNTSFGRYKMSYFYQIDRNGFYWGLKDGAESAILDAVKDITYRLPAEGYVNMPKRINNEIKLTLTPKMRMLYDSLEKDFFLKFDEAEATAFSSAALSMKLRQFIQGAIYVNKQGDYETLHKIKLEALKELMETNAGQPVLCAIQFRFELDMIQKAFPKLEIPVLAGGVSPAKATEYLDKWNKGEVPLLLCHPASLSHGVNIQHGGSIILWYGMTWSPEQYMQLNGRLERQGQKNTVIVHHFIMTDTIDVAVIRSLKARAANQRKVLDYFNEYRKERGL